MKSKLIATVATATAASACIGLGFLLSVQSAQADIINGSLTGLASPGVTLTFDEVVPPVNTPVTNQYSSFGVTFGDVFYTPQQFIAPNFSGGNLGNFVGTRVSNPIDIKFSQIVEAADFAFAANQGTSTFTALLNGTVVSSFDAANPQTAADFFGFSGFAFNEIQIQVRSDNNSGLLDTLQYSAVPAPAAGVGLPGLMLAAGGLLAFARRRRQARDIA